ncbi:MAG: protease inhibitor I42 family protein [Phycisphaerae bacterium]|nr:protease inhibitor I42 family protein [Phycisphaerae bacterium]
MMKYTSLLAAFVALGSAGCLPASSGTVLRLTEQDNGTTAAISLGTRIEVVLSSNPSTGYGWQLTNVNQAILEKTGNAYIPPSNTMPGASGTEQWDFSGRAAGQTPLRMEYRRPWESTEFPAARSFSVTVTVTPGL